ncbi:Nucleolar protein 13, partial [Spiromyces aspiralis]
GKPKRSAWGIWVGNLSFNTTPQQLKRYFRNSCKGMGTVTRIRMPAGPDGKANRGFAYLDFDTEEALNIVLSLSESELDGRAILVKREDDFNKKGRIPDPKQKAEESKRATSSNEPSPTLFVGNLPFDITKVDLRLIFGPFGKIRKVRLATFQDNPAKCKGFAYIDYVDIEDAKKAHAAESKHVWKGRIIRVEYAGELATKKARPWEHFPVPSHIAEKVKHKKRKRQESDTGADQGDGDEDGNGGSDAEPKKQATHVRSNRDLDTENMAETKLQGIPVKFKGKKIVFN